MTFAAALQTQLDRLAASGWTREQIAAATGYTRQRLSAWARGPVEPPHALRVGLLSVLRGLRRPPVATLPNQLLRRDLGQPNALSLYTQPPQPLQVVQEPLARYGAKAEARRKRRKPTPPQT